MSNSCQNMLNSMGPFIFRSFHWKGFIKFLKPKVSIYKTKEMRENGFKEVSKHQFHFQL